jgi:hypothetical protein
MQEIKETGKELTAVRFLYGSIEAAQQKTGAFTLLDCRNIMQAYKKLTKFFENPDGSITEVKLAFDVLVQAIGGQQSKGAFSISGAADLLDNIEYVQGFFGKGKE